MENGMEPSLYTMTFHENKNCEKGTKMELGDVIMCVCRYELVVSTRVNEMVLYSLSTRKIVTVEKNQPATIQMNP